MHIRCRNVLALVLVVAGATVVVCHRRELGEVFDRLAALGSSRGRPDDRTSALLALSIAAIVRVAVIGLLRTNRGDGSRSPPGGRT